MMTKLEAKYTKTDAGRAEIAKRSAALNAGQRRLLIVIDGSRSWEDLAVLVRPGELEAALERLLVLGLIEALDQFAPSVSAAGTAALELRATIPLASHSEDCRQVCQQVARYITQCLGSAAEPICDAIHRCESRVELRKLLRGIEIFVAQRSDPQTTQALMRHFRSLRL